MESLYVELRQVNQQLQQEIRQRQQAEESLRQVQQELELRVAERTAELVLTNQRLQQEIEQRKQVEAALRQRESQWQALFEHTLDAIAIVDDTGRYVDVNSAACELFGASKAELLRSQIADFAEPGFDFVQTWQKFSQQGQMCGEFSIHRLDGTIRETEFAAVANFIPHRHLSILRDISERKQTQKILQEREERLQLALWASSIGIWDWNLQTNKVIWSEHLFSLFGLTPDTFDVSYENFLEIVHPEDREFLKQSVIQAVHEQAPYDLEFRVICPDNTVRWSDCKGKVFYDDTGKPLRMIGVNIDITNRKQANKLLQERETQYRQIVETATEGVWLLDKEGKTSFVNQQMATMLGYTVDEMLGKSLFEFMDEEFQVIASQMLERRQQGIQEQHDFKFRRRDGSDLWVIISTTAILDENGQYCGALGMIADISDRKQYEQALQASEQRLQAILDNCPVAIYMIDSDNKHLVVNRWYAELLSTTPDKLLGKSIYDFWPAELADAFAEHNQQVLQTNQLIQIEEVANHADGLHTYITIKFPICDALGKPSAVCGISTDITERKQAEQKIREQAALIDITTDAIFVRDLENHILFWNQAAERLYGWTAEESRGQKSHELFYKESVPQLPEALNTTLTSGSWYGELQQITKTGQEIIVASRWTLVTDESGKPQSILVVNTDITEKKHLEQQFYRAQRLESVGTLASGIAHDLNNVFAPIMMISQFLPKKCRNVDARTQELFQTLETSSKRGANLVKQILTFARGTEGKRILLQSGHLLKELVKVIQQTFPKSIEIHIDIPTNTLWMVQADPTQLDQVFMNLVVNARDAMPNGGILSISAENRFIDQTYARMHLDAHIGGYVVVTVSDTGTGIPPEYLERIFDPFFTTKEVGKGTGLGLSTVLGIVKNHGGFVQVSSQVSKGTQFQVFLPIAEGTTTETKIEASLPGGNGELILIVDDEKVVQQTVKEMLEDYHYKTLVANDGIEAIALYAEYQQEISIVLIDILMPNMDGLTAIRTLRTINPKVKIIATSGIPNNDQQAIAAGAGIFLSKPYTAPDLLNFISQLIATTDESAN